MMDLWLFSGTKLRTKFDTISSLSGFFIWPYVPIMILFIYGNTKKLQVDFFKTENGNEPVRDFLKALDSVIKNLLEQILWQ